MYCIAATAFEELNYQSAPEALHGWLRLPNDWRSSEFVAACAKLGIVVAAGGAFAVGQSVAPAGVRIAYSAPDLETWKHALQEIATLALTGP